VVVVATIVVTVLVPGLTVMVAAAYMKSSLSLVTVTLGSQLYVAQMYKKIACDENVYCVELNWMVNN